MDKRELRCAEFGAHARHAQCIVMTRRRAVVAGSLAMAAQITIAAGTPVRVGVLMFAPDTVAFQAAFREGLSELGYVEGRDVVIEWRSAAGNPALVARHAADLVRLGVAVIVAEFTPSAIAARRATSTIPIVMAPVGDPIASGLVASLARPGGNVTGHTNMVSELAGKRIELLQALGTGMAHVGMLVSGTDPLDQRMVSTSMEAASRVSVSLHVASMHSARDLDAAFDELARRRCDAVIVPGNLPAPPRQIAAAALKRRMASISVVSNFPEAGGLAFYGASLSSIQRSAAATVDRLLKGVRAAALPVQQPTVFELVLNLSTARALGVQVPQSVLLRATKLID